MSSIWCIRRVQGGKLEIFPIYHTTFFCSSRMYTIQLAHGAPWLVWTCLMTLTPEFFRWRVALASFRSQTSFINFWIMDDFFCKKKLSETVSKKYYFVGRRKCDQIGHFLTILGVILYTLAIIFGKTSPKFGEVLSNFRNGTTFLHFGHSYLNWENFCLNKFGHTGTRCPTFAAKVALFEREKVHWGLHQDLPDLEEGKNKNNATIRKKFFLGFALINRWHLLQVKENNKGFI